MGFAELLSAILFLKKSVVINYQRKDMFKVLLFYKEIEKLTDCVLIKFTTKIQCTLNSASLKIYVLQF